MFHKTHLAMALKSEGSSAAESVLWEEGLFWDAVDEPRRTFAFEGCARKEPWDRLGGDVLLEARLFAPHERSAVELMPKNSAAFVRFIPIT